MRILYKVLVFSGFLIALEIALRLLFGLGTPPLYLADKGFEYIYAPNQKVKRFGHKIITNAYSMRSGPVSKNDTLNILKIGDSVVGGGALTDNDSLASTLLEKRLQGQFKMNFRVLNIAAGSWGPDNAYAYLQKYGHFDAKLMILVFSSHDLYDSMHHEPIVDVLDSYPSKNPFSAISELISRYIYPHIVDLFKKPGLETVSKINGNLIWYAEDHINPGWNDLFSYANRHKIKLYVVLHPTLSEIRSRKYDQSGTTIVRMLDSLYIPYFLELNHHPDTNCYRDDIHYNDKGQRKMADEIYPFLDRYIRSAYYKNGKLRGGNQKN